MIRNYIVIALRNIRRSKVYSLINIAGLSLGIACCLLLALYIQDEMSYDQHHQRLDDLYRLTTRFESAIGLGEQGSVSPPIAMTMKEEIPEIEAATRLLNPPGVAQNLIRYGDNSFYEKEGLIADSTLFDVFTYEFVEGTPKKALVHANTVVITDKLANKLFGNEPALDKIISISQGGDAINFKITGVVKDNIKTHMHGNFFTSMSSDGWAAYLRSDNAANEWAGQNFVPSYVKLSPHHDIKEVERKINQVLIKYGSEDMKALGMNKTLGIEPVKDIYLKSDVGQKSPRIIYIYVIASIAVFILLIACINFMNLSTARATKRANEIGVRKVMGAFRSSLIGQILGEAMVIVLFSIVLSIVVMQLALPFFNNLTGKTISFSSENMGYFSFALAAITIITGLVAGSYPAFYLSSFQPAQVLKGKATMSNASGWLRRSLVVFQFMIAITLVCGMIVISQQLHFMQEEDLGFDAKAKIILPLRTGTSQKNYSTLKNELAKNTAVKQVSGTNYIPGSPIFSDMSFYKDGGNMDMAVNIKRNTIDYGYMELLNIQLLAGRNFTDNPVMERNKLIINKSTARKYDMTPEQIIGHQLHFDWQGKKYDFEVIGVMDDYHQSSLKEEIKPTLFEMADSIRQFDFMIASVDTKNFASTIASMEQTWKANVNDTPFEYSFLDANIQKQYEEDQKVSGIITSFTFIAMLISCLGLYGLSTYMAERRFKEIGVRKVMGASVNQIVGLMSVEFIKLVVIAFIIAVPLAWYGMTKWLEGFAYHVSVNLMIFVYAGGAALLIALLTVSVESIRAASSDPVKALRNE
jgi:putative ABC transport system permease protein